jgi:transposase-like protein
LKQHFLLSAKAVTLSLFEIADMSDDEAYAAFRAVRFADNRGEPYCPNDACRRTACYEYASRRLFKCKACEEQFTVTSKTVFGSHKLKHKHMLMAIKLFVDGVNGEAALHLRRNLGVSYKTAFVLAHKLREAMADLQKDRLLTGTVEVDGVYVGGFIRHKNMKIDRVDDGRRYNDSRRAVVTMRERRPGGRSRSFVLRSEKDAVPILKQIVHPSADIVTDQGTAWGKLYLAFNSHTTVNHTLGHVIHGIHINGVEGYHSRIRRGERGVYVSVSGAHAQNYADEFSWREDHRRLSNGQQFRVVLGRAARMPRSTRWVGYWQKRKPAPAPPHQAA